MFRFFQFSGFDKALISVITELRSFIDNVLFSLKLKHNSTTVKKDWPSLFVKTH